MHTITRKVLYTVIFEDGTEFIGGDNYTDTKWLELPNKKIKEILYKLPDGDYLYLGGYQKYYHMVEALHDLTGKLKGQTRVQNIILIGVKNEVATVYKIGIAPKPGISATVIKYKIPENSSYIKQLNKQGWR